MTYQTIIRNLVLQDLPDRPGLVTRVFYSVIGTDDNEVEGEYYGVINLKETLGTFIPIDEITEELILSWLEPYTEDIQETINDIIQNQIVEKQRNTRFIEPEEFPWN